MFVCPHPTCNCARNYSNAEALIAHVSSSSWASMYYCSTCKCVCRDGSSLRSHMKRVHSAATPEPEAVEATASPHAPTCSKCNQMYITPAALQQHYRDSAAHPSCARCQLGFLDTSVLNEHIRAIHQPINCGLCNGLQVYHEDIISHYRVSPNHPTCLTCNVGFEDVGAFERHIISTHPELRCKKCDLSFGSPALLEGHYRDTSEHPKCPECQISFVDEKELIKHIFTVFNPLSKDSSRLTVPEAQSSASSPIPSFAKLVLSESTRSASVPLIVPNKAQEGSAIVKPNADNRQPEERLPDASVKRAEKGTSHSPQHRPTTPLSGREKGDTSRAGKSALYPKPPSSLSPSVHRLTVTDSPPTSPSLSDVSTIRYSAITHKSMMAQKSKAMARPLSDDDRSSCSSIRTPSPLDNMDAVGLVVRRSPSPDLPVGLQRETASREAAVRQTVSRKASTESMRSGRRGQDLVSPRLLSSTAAHDLSRPPGRPVFSPGLRFQQPPMATLPLPPSGLADHGVSYQPPPQTGRPAFTSALSTLSVIKPRQSPRLDRPRSLIETRQSPSQAQSSGLVKASAADDGKYVSLVYCRLCRRDPCRIPTATMCGHIFCNECIFSETRKSSRCPVCDTPTLPYALFRLHLA